MQGLEAISSKLLGIHTQVKDVEGGLSRWGMAVGGVAAIMAGGAIFKGMETITKAGGELVKQQTLLQNLVQNPGEVTKTTFAAQAATLKIMGTTIAENIKGMREMIGVTNTLDEARALYVPTMRGAKVLEALTGKPAEGNLQILAKAIEQLGGGTNPKTGEVDPQRFESYMREAVKTIIASGGLIDANALLGFSKQAGPMARMTTDPATLFQSYMTAIMDMGGYRAGTALTAAGRQLLGGKMGLSTAQEMSAMGLLVDGKWRKAGTGVRVDEGGLVGEELLKGDNASVAKWFETVFKPALAAHGMKTSSEMNQEMYKVLGTETMRRIAGLFVSNQGQINRDAQLQKGAADVDQAYANLAAGDLGMNIQNLHKAVESFLQAFGAPLVAPAVSALQSLSSVMNTLAGAALAHPEVAKGIGEALIAISAGLVALGGTAVVAAAVAVAGPVTAAVAGIGTAIAVLAALDFTGARAALTGIGETLKTTAQIFAVGAEGLISAAKALGPDLAIALAAAVNAITQGISAGIEKLKSAFADLPAQLSGLAAQAQTAMANVAKALGEAIASIPGKVMGAIAGMAAGLASAIGNAIKGALGGGKSPAGTGEAGGGAFTPGAYHGSGIGAHAQSASLVPPPSYANSGPRVADVWMDHQKVGKVIERSIAMNNRAVNSAAGHDGRDSWAPPDVSFA